MQLFNVTMPWDAEDTSEGTYSTTVRAIDEGHAKRLCATEMADSAKHEYDDDAGRQDYIDTHADGWADVYLTTDQLKQDMSTVFAKQLFPDGITGEINLVALGQVLAENRGLLTGSRTMDLSDERRVVISYALENLIDLLGSPTSADRDHDAAQADRQRDVAKDLLKLIPPIDDAVIRKARALDSLMDELVGMGFAANEPINGGDCVDSIAQIYTRLAKQFPR